MVGEPNKDEAVVPVPNKAVISKEAQAVVSIIIEKVTDYDLPIDKESFNDVLKIEEYQKIDIKEIKQAFEEKFDKFKPKLDKKILHY